MTRPTRWLRASFARMAGRSTAATVSSSIIPAFLILTGLPVASVAVGSWGQLGRHGVAPLWIALLILASLVLIGGIHSLYTRLVFRFLGTRLISITLVGVPLLVSGGIAALVLVRHNWPDRFRQLSILVDVALLQFVIAVLLFICLFFLIIRFQLQKPLTVFTALGTVLLFLPLQIQQGGLRASSTQLVLADQRPISRNVLWIIPDELTASAVFMPSGKVWPSLPNISRLQRTSTTYTSAVAVSVNTSQAIPAMLSGISDLRTIQPSDLASLARKRGVLSPLSEVMTTRISSPFFTSLDPQVSLFERIVSQPIRIGKELLSVTLDLIFSPRLEDAVTGPNGFIGRFFPDSGADFWGTTRQRDSTSLDHFNDLLNERAGSEVPWFFVWHSLDTHSPWNVDQDGLTLSGPQEPCPDGARCAPLSAVSGSSDERESEILSRRLAAMSAQFFDKRVGQFLNLLEESGSLERTIIVIGSDHGTAIASTDGGRHFAGATLMRDGVAHVPLIIKYSEQSIPIEINTTVSMGQILPSVIADLGAGVDAIGFQMSPPLPRGPTHSGIEMDQLEIGTWIGYDDLWSWRSLTWIPISSVGLYGGDDWFANEQPTTLDQLGFAAVELDSFDRYRDIPDAVVVPIDGESPIALIRIEYPISSCPRQSIGVVIESKFFVKSRFTEALEGSTAQSWVAVMRRSVPTLQVWCKFGP